MSDSVSISHRNHGSHAAWNRNRDGRAPDLRASQPVECPFCLRKTTATDHRLAPHVEAGGFTQCPASGHDLTRARRLAKRLTPAYLLPNEGGLEE